MRKHGTWDADRGAGKYVLSTHCVGTGARPLRDSRQAPRSSFRVPRRPRLVLPLLLGYPILVCTGCDRLDMYDQPRYEPLEASDFFDDGLSARPNVEGTIARGQLREDQTLYTGRVGVKLVARIPESAYRLFYDQHPARFAKPIDALSPAELRQAFLQRGRERFNIHCSVCHGRTGTGNGMVVQRGFRKPSSYHIDRLRNAPAGYLFDVVTHGFGAMPSFAGRIDVEDRWAIVAYIRALQLSQDGRLEDVPESQRTRLDRSRGPTRENSDPPGASVIPNSSEVGHGSDETEP